MVSAAKAALRRALRRARRALPPAQRAAEAEAVLAALAPLAMEGPLASYAALPDELDLAPLHAARWRAGLPVWLPRVVGSQLIWHAVRAPDQLAAGAWGIPEPDPGLVPEGDLPHGCLVLVPGLGFTPDGGRLGQGGGYYDRALAARTDLVAIGVGFACQLVAALPLAPHDVRLAAVLLAGRWWPAEAPQRFSAGRWAGTAGGSAG